MIAVFNKQKSSDFFIICSKHVSQEECEANEAFDYILSKNNATDLFAFFFFDELSCVY